MKCNYIIILYIITVFLLIFINWNNSDCYNNTNNLDNYLTKITFLNGYWISNDEFNNASDIDKMIIYIDYNNNSAKLVIISNNQIVTNTQYQIYIDEENINNSSDMLYTFNITFISDTESIWNNKSFQCILNINTGNIKLIDNKNKIVYGDLFKDNIITSFINSATN